MIVTEGKTLQQVADEIIEKLLNQKTRCVGTDNDTGEVGCLYGDRYGNHCAVGWLLPPEDERLMEFSGGVPGLLTQFDNLGQNDEFIRRNEDFLWQMQNLHDHSTLEDDFDRKKQKLLDRFGVDVEKLRPFWNGEVE